MTLDPATVPAGYARARYLTRAERDTLNTGRALPLFSCHCKVWTAAGCVWIGFPVPGGVSAEDLARIPPPRPHDTSA